MTTLAGKTSRIVAGLAVATTAGLVYLLTLDNGLRLDELLGGDLITHQYAQVQARPANAPGYPIYTMLGWLWFQVGRALLSAWLNPTQILSLYSTLWAMAALLTLYTLLLEVTDRNAVLAALTTTAFAVTYFFWYYSVTTEQYTSAVFQTLLIILLAFRWEQTRRVRYLHLLALLVGLSLAHMITVLLVVPALLWFILSAEPGLLRRWRLIGQCALLALLPLLSYAYVYWRGAQHPEWWGSGDWPNAWAWFWDFVSTRQGWEELTWAPSPFPGQFLRLIVGEVTLPVLGVGLAGLTLLSKRRAVFLFSTLVLYVVFCYIDRNGNWYQVLMPMYPVLFLGLGLVAHWARELPRRPTLLRGVIILGLIALAVNRLWVNWPRADQSSRHDDDGLRAGLTIVADNPDQDAAIIASYDVSVSLQYVTQIWGQRSDLQLVMAQEAASILQGGAQTLYTTPEAVAMATAEIPAYHLSSHGRLLIEILPQAQVERPEIQYPLDLDLGDNLRLLGYDAEENLPGSLAVTLYWQATGRIEHDYAVSLRPTWQGQSLATNGGIIQQDRPHPVWGAYPTSHWQLGEIVKDAYSLDIPLAQRYDGASVIVYRVVEGGFENLAVVQLELDLPPQQP